MQLRNWEAITRYTNLYANIATNAVALKTFPGSDIEIKAYQALDFQFLQWVTTLNNKEYLQLGGTLEILNGILGRFHLANLQQQNTNVPTLEQTVSQEEVVKPDAETFDQTKSPTENPSVSQTTNNPGITVAAQQDPDSNNQGNPEQPAMVNGPILEQTASQEEMVRVNEKPFEQTKNSTESVGIIEPNSNPTTTQPDLNSCNPICHEQSALANTSSEPETGNDASSFEPVETNLGQGHSKQTPKISVEQDQKIHFVVFEKLLDGALAPQPAGLTEEQIKHLIFYHDTYVKNNLPENVLEKWQRFENIIREPKSSSTAGKPELEKTSAHKGSTTIPPKSKFMRTIAATGLFFIMCMSAYYFDVVGLLNKLQKT